MESTLGLLILDFFICSVTRLAFGIGGWGEAGRAQVTMALHQEWGGAYGGGLMEARG